MAWANKVTATQLVTITTEQFFSWGGSQLLSFEPGKSYHFWVKANPPATPTDHLIVAVYPSNDDSSEGFDEIAWQEFYIDKAKDPNRVSFTIYGTDIRKGRIGVRRSGTVDTYTDTDAQYSVGAI